MDVGRGLRELRRGVVEYCVLALLRQRPMYGLELVKVLEDAGRLVTSLGTIYPLLARLRADGLVTTTTKSSEHGPARRYYHITLDGERLLGEFTTEWHRFRTSVDTLLNGEDPE